MNYQALMFIFKSRQKFKMLSSSNNRWCAGFRNVFLLTHRFRTVGSELPLKYFRR